MRCGLFVSALRAGLSQLVLRIVVEPASSFLWTVLIEQPPISVVSRVMTLAAPGPWVLFAGHRVRGIIVLDHNRGIVAFIAR